jgi:hypothetical protein
LHTAVSANSAVLSNRSIALLRLDHDFKDASGFVWCLRMRRKRKMTLLEIAAKTTIDATAMPANAPDDSVMELDECEEGFGEGPLEAKTVLAGCKVDVMVALLGEVVAAGSAATLDVHASAAPASL